MGVGEGDIYLSQRYLRIYALVNAEHIVRGDILENVLFLSLEVVLVEQAGDVPEHLVVKAVNIRDKLR